MRSLSREPITRYIIIIVSSISILLITETIYDGLIPANSSRIRFLSDADKLLVINFVEWFGVLYGFLLPTILVRVWEQFDKIDNTFDKEADAIKILIGDLSLLQSHHNEFSSKVLRLLQEYAENVLGFISGNLLQDLELEKGKKTLAEVRKLYLEVFHQAPGGNKENDVLIDELLAQLNNIIDHRGDRVSLSTQRLFESLNFIAVITSIVWLVPLYFLYFQDNKGNDLQLGIFGWLLVVAVTFLVIIILTIIEDLDNPFDGYWRVNISSWKNLVSDIGDEINNLQRIKIEINDVGEKKTRKRKPKQQKSTS
jgi:hypothetical protein